MTGEAPQQKSRLIVKQLMRQQSSSVHPNSTSVHTSMHFFSTHTYTCTDPHLYRPASYSICKSAASEMHHVDYGSGLFSHAAFFFIFKIWIIVIVLCSFRLHGTEKQTGQGVLLTAGGGFLTPTNVCVKQGIHIKDPLDDAENYISNYTLQH